MNEEPVRFEASGVVFAGTLTLPEGPGPHPAALLISGGNPVDRDCEVEGFRPFRLLARRLGRSGVATLRYDDRGVGESGGGSFYDSVLADHERDVLGALDLLRSRAEIDAARIGLIGHSWGGSVAARVAANAPERVAFIVALGSPGETGDAVMLRVREALSASGGDEERERGRRLQVRLHRAARTREGFDELQAEIREDARRRFVELDAGQRAEFPSFDDYFQATADRFLLRVARTPFFRGLLEHDPLPDMERVTCPVLLCFGGADPFVPVEPNRGLITAALERGGHAGFDVVVVPRAEHFFRDPELSMQAFVPGFPDEISRWILDRTRPPG